MKFLPHLLAVAVGLIVGFTMRASMRPKLDPVSPQGPSSLLSKANRSGSAQKVARVLSMIEGERLTVSQTASVHLAILDLPESQFPALISGLLASEWMDNETALDALFSAWGEVAPLDALAMVSQLPRIYRARTKRQVLNSWVLTDADAAFAYVNQGPRKATQLNGHTNESPLWNTLTHTVPHEALARAERIENADARRQREDQIVGTLSHQDPQFALLWLKEHRDGAEQKNALPGVLRGWMATEPRKAFDYLVSLDDAVQSREAFESFSRGLNLELATELRESVPDKYHNAFWGSYIERHAQSSPAEAAALTDSLPEGSPRRKALETIAAQWSFVDLESASEWVNTLPRSRSRDSAISAFAHQLMTTDPEAGVRWFADMDHAGDRAPHLHNALVSWLRKDQAAASEWMGSQSTERLPAKIKAAVLAPAPKS